MRSPGARPHQTHHHHHLMSAKAYQTMVWADLSPENPSGSSSSRSLAAAGGAGGGEDEEQGLLSRRRGGRKGRRQGGGGGGGGAASRGPGARGPAGSTLELGPAAGVLYREPTRRGECVCMCVCTRAGLQVTVRYDAGTLPVANARATAAAGAWLNSPEPRVAPARAQGTRPLHSRRHLHPCHPPQQHRRPPQLQPQHA